MSGHTPGPWIAVERVGNLVDINYGTGAIASVALWSCGKAGSPEENAANARLIAAAPELLVGCQGALLLFEELLKSFRHAGFPPISNSYYVAGVLRAAIAEAEGK